MQGHKDISWFHSIDLGDGEVTKGRKSFSALETEFNCLQLTKENLSGKRVLDIGCNDGFMSLKCARLGADVTSVDGVSSDGLRFIRKNLPDKFQFYAIDMMSPSFYELGRFDVVLYFGVLYHTMYVFEQMLRLAGACKDGAMVLLESAYIDLPGCEGQPTVLYNYDGSVHADLGSPCFPSCQWIIQTLQRVGFTEVTALERRPGLLPGRGRVSIRGYYDGSSRSPFLYAQAQMR